ncbi:transglycosylase associated protein [Citrobacter portucalensis]|nr:transglycosylase associated protein [Citrobacter portucalensis]
MGIIAWIIFGLIAGVIAKLIMPGRDGGGFILTCILGVVGAVVGGWLATMFGIGGDVSGFISTASWWPWSARLLCWVSFGLYDEINRTALWGPFLYMAKSELVLIPAQ